MTFESRGGNIEGEKILIINTFSISHNNSSQDNFSSKLLDFSFVWKKEKWLIVKMILSMFICSVVSISEAYGL